MTASIDPIQDQANQDLKQALNALDVPGVRKALRDGANPLVLDDQLMTTASASGLVNYVLLAAERVKDELHRHRLNEFLELDGGRYEPTMSRPLDEQLNEGLKDLASRVHGVLSTVLKKAPDLPVTVPHKRMLPVHTAALMGLGNALSLLVKYGADPAQASAYGRTAMHWAAHGGSAAMIRRLANKGVPVDSQDQGGLTPAHMAAAQGLPAPMRELKRQGADMELKDHNGLTPGARLKVVDNQVGQEWARWERHFESSQMAKRLSRSLDGEDDSAPSASRKPKARF